MTSNETEVDKTRRSIPLAGAAMLLAAIVLIPVLAPIAKGILSMLLLVALIVLTPTLLRNSVRPITPLFMFHYHGVRTPVMDEISKELS